jgi:hypothetical protein
MKTRLQTDLHQLLHRHERRVETIRAMPQGEEQTRDYLIAEERRAYSQALQDRLRYDQYSKPMMVASILVGLGVLAWLLAIVIYLQDRIAADKAGLGALGFAVAGGLCFLGLGLTEIAKQLGSRSDSTSALSNQAHQANT